MRLAMKFLAVLAAGIFLGLFATWLTVIRGIMPEGVSDGPWHADLAAGSVQSDPYTRAFVALHGLFALNSRETLYYTAESDDAGAPLSGACRYDLAGHDLDARWWSITAYGPDDFLIPNPAGRYAVSKSTVKLGQGGSFDIAVGAGGAGRNWIPTGTDRFSLTLRLYNPGQLVAADPAHAELPAIKKGSCS